MAERDADDTEPLSRAVGARIRLLRERSGLSQQAFASAAGMKRQFANRVELGLQNLSLRTMGRIAIALGTSMAALLEGIGPDGSVDGALPADYAPERDSARNQPQANSQTRIM